jgi:hypothetical protein
MFPFTFKSFSTTESIMAEMNFTRVVFTEKFGPILEGEHYEAVCINFETGRMAVISGGKVVHEFEVDIAIVRDLHE